MPIGISLHIGVNRVDPNHYPGNYPPLKGPEYDAEDMQFIADSIGFDTTILLAAQATRGAMLASIREAGDALNAGDIFLLTFSGHGGTLPDGNGDETDGQDETWCMYDGQIADDELYQYYCYFKEGVRILVVSDSCHSGTVIKFRGNEKTLNKRSFYKNLPEQQAMDTYIANKVFYDNIRTAIPERYAGDLKASMKLLAACRDNQKAEDGDFNSQFTKVLKAVWQDGNFQGNYQDFYNELLSSFSGSSLQTPHYELSGRSDTEYDNQKPFTI